jgi:ribulose-bisphosphate carboxylase large chain
MSADRAVERLRVTYRLTCADGEDPVAKAQDIAYEQTVELPAGHVSPDVAARIVGRVETVEPLGDSCWRTVVSFDEGIVGDDLAQLLNLVFGNISMKAGILLAEIDWPKPLLGRLGGPRFGIEGLRWMAGVRERRPLLCGALKPLGLSADRLAQICHELARGGIDIVKDDHSLVDQGAAPFRERVERCQDAVTRANRETGGNSHYFPNVTGPVSAMCERAELARRAGCRGVLVSPLLVGLDAVGALADACNVAIMAHPSLAGGFFNERHGIAPEVLLGELFRVAGSDAVIYPNVGGRFTLSAATCDAINARLRGPLDTVKPAFPVPGGGIDAARVPEWIDRYGVDTIFLIGGSLYAQRDLTDAARRLLQAVRRHSDG